jgi:hypothetical protein
VETRCSCILTPSTFLKSRCSMTQDSGLFVIRRRLHAVMRWRRETKEYSRTTLDRSEGELAGLQLALTAMGDFSWTHAWVVTDVPHGVTCSGCGIRAHTEDCPDGEKTFRPCPVDRSEPMYGAPI